VPEEAATTGLAHSRGDAPENALLLQHGEEDAAAEDGEDGKRAGRNEEEEEDEEDEGEDGSGDGLRLPRNVQALYLRPLRRQAVYGVPACDLQLRSFSVRNVEFMADFALRAAYYLHLPAAGPVPLPRRVERWTVPRGSFIHKKSQENFERVTLRRLIQIQDAHPAAVEVWLAYLRKHQYYGVGMKANVWDYEKLGMCVFVFWVLVIEAFIPARCFVIFLFFCENIYLPPLLTENLFLGPINPLFLFSPGGVSKKAICSCAF
jgi:ribosomal protein S10